MDWRPRSYAPTMDIRGLSLVIAKLGRARGRAPKLSSLSGKLRHAAPVNRLRRRRRVDFGIGENGPPLSIRLIREKRGTASLSTIAEHKRAARDPCRIFSCAPIEAYPHVCSITSGIRAATTPSRYSAPRFTTSVWIRFCVAVQSF
jgi:hypothetical protein